MITQADIQKMADVIVQKFRPEKVILFGSYARGEATEDSDVDLLVVDRCDDVDPRVRRQQAIDMRLALWGFKAAIDILLRTPRQLDDDRDCAWSVAAAALSEGVVLYG